MFLFILFGLDKDVFICLLYLSCEKRIANPLFCLYVFSELEFRSKAGRIEWVRPKSVEDFRRWDHSGVEFSAGPEGVVADELLGCPSPERRASNSATFTDE